jgi:DNA polymerase-3 subunit gamma/tau
LKCWNDYTASIKKHGKPISYHIFNRSAEAAKGVMILKLPLVTKAQENAFRDEKPDLLNYMRAALKNFDLTVTTRVDEHIANKRPYTAVEKFQHMAAKNPQLAELRKRFNLDLE